jgi:hypothetical protein
MLNAHGTKARATGIKSLRETASSLRLEHWWRWLHIYGLPNHSELALVLLSMIFNDTSKWYIIILKAIKYHYWFWIVGFIEMNDTYLFESIIKELWNYALERTKYIRRWLRVCLIQLWFAENLILAVSCEKTVVYYKLWESRKPFYWSNYQLWIQYLLYHWETGKKMVRMCTQRHCG